MAGSPSLSVCVAFKDSTNGERGRSWDFVRMHLERDFPDAEILVGTDDSRPFNKAAALNRAVAASSGDVLLITDADTWTDPEQVRAAMGVVGQRWCRPYRIKLKLFQPDSERALEAGLDWKFERTSQMRFERVTSFKWAPPLLVTRAMHEAVGGLDERFAGWGSEDHAYGLALDALFGEQISIRGFAIHLWHPRIGTSGHDLWDGQDSVKENTALLESYRRARTATAMRSLVDSRT